MKQPLREYFANEACIQLLATFSFALDVAIGSGIYFLICRSLPNQPIPYTYFIAAWMLFSVYQKDARRRWKED